MKLPFVAKNNVILVIYNKLSKITHFVTRIEETSVKRCQAWFTPEVKVYGVGLVMYELVE